MSEKFSWYKKIAAAILSVKTFDLDDDEGGYPTIHYLIANYLLKDLTEYMRVTNLGHYAGMVSRNIDQACSYIEDKGVPVYRVIEPGKRNISCVTLDPVYRDAKEKEAEKVVTRANRAIELATSRLHAIEQTARIVSLPRKLSLLSDGSGADVNQLPLPPQALPLARQAELAG